ncbi:MAG: TIGR02147 family protein [Fibrobacteria bacterium]|nr:TIGR02147 family protein [Fibrobacteria bacterium]
MPKKRLADEGGVGRENSNPDVFQFTDYRKYLREFYEERKRRDRRVSHRWIAQRVGFRSSGLFAQILTGLTNLSEAMVERFVPFLGLGTEEAEYFRHLVRFNQAKSYRAKRDALELLLKYDQVRVRTLEASQYEYYGSWVPSAVRAVLGFGGFQGDFAELGRRLEPSVSAAEAKKSVELLERLGLVRRSPDGVWEVMDGFISSGSETTGVALRNYHIAVMDLAREALERFPREVRNASTVTVGVSARGWETISRRIDELRREILEIARDEEDADRVYQVNIHAFPLTRKIEGDPEEGTP